MKYFIPVFALFLFALCNQGTSSDNTSDDSHFFILDELDIMKSNATLDGRNAVLYNQFEMAKLVNSWFNGRRIKTPSYRISVKIIELMPQI